MQISPIFETYSKIDEKFNLLSDESTYAFLTVSRREFVAEFWASEKIQIKKK